MSDSLSTNEIYNENEMHDYKHPMQSTNYKGTHIYTVQFVDSAEVAQSKQAA